jgi:hypothetical protein
LTDEDALTVDGAEVQFQKLADGSYSVHLAVSGEELGTLERSRLTNHFEAHTPDGRPLQMPSRWSGTINAVFGTRELAVRALLEDREEAAKGT